MGHLEENCAQTLSRPLFAPLQLHAKNGQGTLVQQSGFFSLSDSHNSGTSGLQVKHRLGVISSNRCTVSSQATNDLQDTRTASTKGGSKKITATFKNFSRSDHPPQNRHLPSSFLSLGCHWSSSHFLCFRHRLTDLISAPDCEVRVICGGEERVADACNGLHQPKKARNGQFCKFFTIRSPPLNPSSQMSFHSLMHTIASLRLPPPH